MPLVAGCCLAGWLKAGQDSRSEKTYSATVGKNANRKESLQQSVSWSLRQSSRNAVCRFSSVHGWLCLPVPNWMLSCYCLCSNLSGRFISFASEEYKFGWETCFQTEAVNACRPNSRIFSFANQQLQALLRACLKFWNLTAVRNISKSKLNHQNGRHVGTNAPAVFNNNTPGNFH